MITTINPAHSPAPTAARRAGQVPVPSGFYAAVNVAGRLSLLDAGTGQFPTGRGAVTGTGLLYRIRLDGGIACWLDADQQDGSGEINVAASLICAGLSRQPFTGPADAPFVCGPAVFTATSGAAAPAGLSDTQLARVTDAHAAADDDIHTADAYVDAETASPAAETAADETAADDQMPAWEW